MHPIFTIFNYGAIAAAMVLLTSFIFRAYFSHKSNQKAIRRSEFCFGLSVEVALSCLLGIWFSSQGWLSNKWFDLGCFVLGFILICVAAIIIANRKTINFVDRALALAGLAGISLVLLTIIYGIILQFQESMRSGISTCVNYVAFVAIIVFCCRTTKKEADPNPNQETTSHEAPTQSNTTPSNQSLPDEEQQPFDLDRFAAVQEATYADALHEIQEGCKQTHWMWFIFPQITGLGYSPLAIKYGISGLAEARAYMQHPILGPRLLEVSESILQHSDKKATDILGELDALKLRSCMTLFAEACPEHPVFQQVLDAFYAGEKDPLTLEKLRPTDNQSTPTN